MNNVKRILGKNFIEEIDDDLNTTKRRLKEGLTKKKIIEGMNKLLETHHYDSLTLRDVGEEVGFPAGNIYYHFKTKAELGRAVLEERESIGSLNSVHHFSGTIALSSLVNYHLHDIHLLQMKIILDDEEIK